VLFLAAAPQAGDPLSERAAVVRALESNGDIRLSRLELRRDSLSLAATLAHRLPEVTVEGENSLRFGQETREERLSGPLPGAALEAGTQQKQLNSLSLGLEATQPLPGGASIGAGIDAGYDRNLQADSSVHTRNATVEIRQQLARGAWGHDPVWYPIRIRRLEHERFTLEQEKSLLKDVSAIRRDYWALYTTRKLRGLYTALRDYARSRLETDRRRFQIGTAAPIDTLASALELLKAEERLLGIEVKDSLAQRALARDLDLPVDAVVPDTAAAVSIQPLPPAGDFIRMVERFDPQLRIFATLHHKAQLQLGHARNALLPELSIGVGYARNSARPGITARLAEERDNAFLSLLLRYSLPTHRARIARQQAMVDVQRNAIQRDRYRRELVDGVEELGFTWERERRSLVVAQTAMSLSRRRWQAAQAGFDAGTVDRLTLEKAYNDYLDAATGLLEKQVELKILEISFDEMTGRVFERFAIQAE
jgi:outer membrane protein TolC